jgi:toxin ParE1/3/4
VRYTQGARAAYNHAIAARDDLQVEARLVQRFTAAEIMLGRFPRLGRAGKDEGTRELVLSGTPYIFVYRIEASVVVILDIRHSSRKP